MWWATTTLDATTRYDSEYAGTTGPTPTGAGLFNRYFSRLVSRAHTDRHLSEAFYRSLDDPPSKLVMGVRPEHIQLATDDDDNVIEASVNVVEPLGDLTYVYIPLGDQTLTASLIGDTQVTEQTDIELIFPEDRLHVFDRTTGEALKHPEVDLDAATVDESAFSQEPAD